MKTKAPKRSFGRREAVDERDKKFPLMATAEELTGAKNWASGGWHGDQHATPRCVGYAWAHWLHGYPIRQFLNPKGIYTFAQFLDEWAGEQYGGTSVRAGAKVLRKLGAITEYRWTWEAGAVAKHVLNKGPVVIGVNWYTDMHYPQDSGLMKPSGMFLGGHALVITGFDADSNLFRLKNSYGPHWGKRGYAYLRAAALQKLLKEGGEACVGVERRIVAP